MMMMTHEIHVSLTRQDTFINLDSHLFIRGGGEGEGGSDEDTGKGVLETRFALNNS